MLPTQAPDGAQAFRPVTGGAAVNTAIALARLGQPTGFFGGLSNDAFGNVLWDTLQTEGINLSRVTRVKAATTLSFVHLKNGTQSFSFYDTDSAGRVLSPTDIPSLDGVSALVLGGISLIHRPAGGTFEALMQIAGDARLTLFDANIRPSLIEDQEDSYRQRLGRMIAMADILKFSEEDLDWLHPDPPERLLTGRASLVVHTHEAKGADIYSRSGHRHIPAEKVDVVDTLGAGDTFNAGLLSSLANKTLLSPAALAKADLGALISAATYACRAATASVTRHGANPPTKEDLQ